MLFLSLFPSDKPKGLVLRVEGCRSNCKGYRSGDQGGGSNPILELHNERLSSRIMQDDGVCVDYDVISMVSLSY